MAKQSKKTVKNPVKKVVVKKDTTKAKAPVKGQKIAPKTSLKSKQIIYKKTTDKVGDVLVNQAGVKFQLKEEKKVVISGNNPNNKLKMRVFTISPKDKSVGGSFEMSEFSIKYARENKILKREKRK